MKGFACCFPEDDPCCGIDCYNGGYCNLYATEGTTTAIPLSDIQDNSNPATAPGDVGCECMPGTEGDQCEGKPLKLNLIVIKSIFTNLIYTRFIAQGLYSDYLD